MKSSARYLVTVLATLALGACESVLPDWLGDVEPPPLPGERISVLSLETSITPDPAIADLVVRLPRPYVNTDWPQLGGHPTHAMHHLAMAEAPRLIWSAGTGAGSDDLERLLAAPIYAEGMVFVLDARGNLSAHRADNGERVWRYSMTPPGEDPGALGGGLAYAEETLYVATGYGYVHALEPATGEVLWGQRLGVPLRGAPTIEQGRVLVISNDNRLHALDTAEGNVQWTHVGIAEKAGLMGSASPAATGGLVVAPYSSGELFALRAANGRVAWVDSLTRAGRLTALSELSDINGAPVIDRGVVYAVSHAGRMVAIDLRSGNRIWDQDIGSVQTPWIAGDFLFVLTIDAQIIALSRKSGRIRWVQQLARFEDPEDRTDPVDWAGPVLAGDRIIAVSSQGVAIAISPYDGHVIGQIELSDAVSISPIVANGTLFFLTDDAELLAYR